MSWPGVSDYQEAVQSPKLCFGDAALAAGSPVLTKLGLPRPISGGNASVYQIRTGKTEFAVRCFLRDVRDLRERYAAIGEHLRRSKLASTVGFDYLQDGIRIRGRFVPVLKMEWVRGVPLNEHVASIRSDGAALRRLADDWRALLRTFQQAQVAHGDLQHGNVLVAKGQLIAIDYDGMWVPALAGRPGLELGHPSFQHPQRGAGDFGADMDRFAALVIDIALRALAERPQLWQTYDNADNLLFTRDDFADPAASPLFQELLRHGSPELVVAVRALMAASTGPFAAVPTIEAAWAAKGPAPAPAAALPTQAAARPQWLSQLMAEVGTGQVAAAATAIGPAAPAAGSPVAFSLLQTWRYPGTVAGAAPRAAATRPARERSVVLGVLAVLVVAALLLLWPPGAWLAAAALVAALGLRRVRARRGAASAHPTGAVLAALSDGRSIAVLGAEGAVHLLAADTGRQLRALADAGAPSIGVAALAGGGLAVADRSGLLRLLDGAFVERHAVRLPRASCLCSSADGRLLAVGTHGGKVRIVGADGQDRAVLQGHVGTVGAVAFARDEALVVTGGEDHSVRIWSLTTGACEHVFAGHTSPVLAVARSDNGRFVAAGAADGSLAIWDGKRHKLLHTLRLGGGPVLALAFAPDQAQLLATTQDRSIRCIDAIAGKVLGRVAGHAAPAVALAIEAGGARVVTADATGAVLAWQRRVRSAAGKARALQLAQP